MKASDLLITAGLIVWLAAACFWPTNARASSVAALPASTGTTAFRADTAPTPAETITAAEIDVQQIVFDHIQDAYTWHIAAWNGREVAIPLPVVVRSAERGWFVFLSSRVHKGHTHQGFYVSPEGTYKGKVVEKNSRGEEVRPLDISVTKNVAALWLSCMLLTGVVLGVARWYKRHPLEAPRGFVGMMEMAIVALHDGVIKENIGPAYKPYGPYLLTVFFFVLINNLMGLIPVFPGGANVTGNIAVTLVLALITFGLVNIFATRTYWKDIFWPRTPIFLKLPLPIMPFVEFFGILTKPFALMIRLFANIMAGHTILLGLTCLIFITVSMGPVINGSMTVVSVLFCIFMNCIELLVACIQAYIFTLLSAVYIGLAQVKE